MNRKMNPWVSLIALMLLVVILVTTCTGCAKVEAEEEDAATPTRFNVEAAQYTTAGTVFVITDTETEVQYLFIRNGHGCGLTKMEG